MVANLNSHSRLKQLWADDAPPADIEAEMVALGSLYVASETDYQSIASMISEEMFLSEDHRIIYRAITQCREAGAYDGFLVRKVLEDRGQLEEIGGVEYLNTVLLDSSPGAACAQAHLHRLVEIHKLRMLDSLAGRIRKAVRSASTATDKADQIVEKCQVELAKLVEAGASNEILSLGQIMAGVMTRMKGGGAPRVPSGLNSFDNNFGGFGLGEMAIIAARPSMGKSLLGKQLAAAMAGSGTPVGYINVEEENDKLGRNWLSLNAHIDNHRVRRGSLTRNEWAAAEEWAAAASTTPLYCCDKAFTLAAVIRNIQVMKARFKIKAVFVDYLQLIDPRLPKAQREQEVAVVSRRLKNTFKKLGIAGIVMAQLNRGNEKAGPIRAPRLNDLRESGQIEQDADLVLMIHRPGYYQRKSGIQADNTVQIVVAKNRDGSRDKDIILTANLEHQQFEDNQPQTTYHNDPFAQEAEDAGL